MQAKKFFVGTLMWAILALSLLSPGCKEKGDMTQNAVRDEELDAAFFSGV